MVRFERTTDAELIRRIMTHPRLYAEIADDYYPPRENFWPMMGENVHYLLAREEGNFGVAELCRGAVRPQVDEDVLGLVITHPINAILFEVHHALLPRCWGAKALEIGATFEAWLWTHTTALKAIGFTPSCNALALRYARKAGMTEAGRVKHCYQKAFQLHDIIIFEKSKPAELMAVV